MHSFNAHGAEKSEEKCTALQGKVCDTKATVTEEVDHHDGRVLSQEVEVTGDGCLPKECVGQEDLHSLASFMHSQTREIMPGVDTKVMLNVDCSKSGGGRVAVGGSKPKGKRSRHG